MKAHVGVFPLKQQKQLCIVVPVVSTQQSASFPLRSESAHAKYSKFKNSPKAFYCLWCKNNLNCELNSSFSSCYLRWNCVVQRTVRRSVQTLLLSVWILCGPAVSCSFLSAANNLCLTCAMQQHNYPSCPSPHSLNCLKTQCTEGSLQSRNFS